MMILNAWQDENIPKTGFCWKFLKVGVTGLSGNRARCIPSAFTSCSSLDKLEWELTKLHASDGNKEKRQKQLHLAWGLVAWSLGCHQSSPLALMAHLLVPCHVPIPTRDTILLEKRVWLSYKCIEWSTEQAPPPAIPSFLFMFLGEENEGLHGGQ